MTPERKPPTPARSTEPGPSLSSSSPLPAPMTSEAIKAFAHPLRTAMYQYLTSHGSATASELARHLGESTGQTSYHLRQLERHGLIEDDPDKAAAGGRERWWRTVSFSLDPRALDDPAARTAAQVALRAVVAERARTLQAWFEVAETESTWVDGALHRETTVELSADELAEVSTAINEAAEPLVERAKRRAAEERTSGREAGPERRRIRLYLDVFPLALDD
jgi:DNA-binding transcriptional ArsR family regulator